MSSTHATLEDSFAFSFQNRSARSTAKNKCQCRVPNRTERGHLHKHTSSLHYKRRVGLVTISLGRIKPEKSAKLSSRRSRKKGSWYASHLYWWYCYSWWQYMMWRICRDEFGMPAVLLDVGAAGHCLYREVLWAEDSRPGVKFALVWDLKWKGRMEFGQR